MRVDAPWLAVASKTCDDAVKAKISHRVAEVRREERGGREGGRRVGEISMIKPEMI